LLPGDEVIDSDLDDSDREDEQDGDEGEDTDIVFCVYDKVSRVVCGLVFSIVVWGSSVEMKRSGLSYIGTESQEQVEDGIQGRHDPH
jgi:hypothetical protein